MGNKKNNNIFYHLEVPKGWAIKKLGEIIEYKKGFPFKTEQYKESGVRIIRVSDTNAEGIKNEGLIFLDKEESERFSEYRIIENDIIIQTVGSRPPMYDSMVGKTIIVDKFFEGSLLNQNAVRLRAKNGINKFLFASLKTKRYLNFIETLVRGNANQVSITLEDIFSFQLFVPPDIEQIFIAACLSAWDTAIQKTTQLIAQKELRKKWLMQQLLTGKKRLKGFEGEWKKVGAGEIFKSTSIKGFDSEQLLSATQDRGIIPRSMLETKVTMPSGETTSFKLVEKGNFVISLRSHQGGLEYSRYRGIVSPAYTVLKSKKKICDEFYKHYFKSHDFIGHLAVAVIGIRDGKQISYEDFCMVKIPDLSLEEQTAIAQILQTADREIQLLKAKVEKMKEQKKGVMQVLLTGKKRLILTS